MDRRVKYKKRYHCTDILRHAKKGWSVAQICELWGISKVTFYEWVNNKPEFEDAYEKYKTNVEAWYCALAIGGMTGQIKNFQPRMFEYMSKVFLRWTEPAALKAPDEKEIKEVKSEIVVYKTKWGSNVETTPTGSKDDE